MAPSSGSSSSIARTASPSPSHPLRQPPSPIFTSAQDSLFPSSSNSLIPPPSPSSPSAGFRSRKGTPSLRVEADVTRPSLKRIVSSATTITPVGEGGGGQSNSGSARGSLDELSRTGKEGLAEREIIVHELLKTDTIASISLQYGITPQALRSSNRLWPSDSIHLRRSLNIPLDACHLPSATSGFERLVREEDGNIVVWQRPSAPNGGIISPKARRLASASAFELGEGQGVETDLIGLWATGSSSSLLDSGEEASARSSFDLPDDPREFGHGRYSTTGGGYHDVTSNGKGKGKGKGRVDSPAPEDDAVANYLRHTHNPYSSHSSSPAPLLSFSPSPSPLPASNSEPPDPSLSPSSTSSSLSPPSPMQKKTLTISRVPSSTLSFFPPSSASNSALSSARSSVSEEDYRPPSSPNKTLGRKGSFFGPLANSLARLSLPSNGGGVGPIALGLGGSSWSSSSSLSGDAGTTPKASANGAEAAKEAGGGWDLSYFGGEEEDGAAGEGSPWAAVVAVGRRVSASVAAEGGSERGRTKKGRGRGKMKD